MSNTPNPIVPLTLEGSAVLHQMLRARSGAQHALASWLRTHPNSAAYSLLGHKGDLLLLHFRKDFTELALAQDEVRKFGGLDVVHSYLSVVELGLYESTRKIWDELTEKGLAPGGEGWEAALEETLERQRKAMAPRLRPEIPAARYICFYPMDRLRGEQKNWYTIPFAERQRMMMEHGMVGRKYAGTVKQIISGSVGFDDWEWGVDLFADDPLWFKRLIYEMRFDEVSAVYAKFGPFYNGVRLQPEDLERGLTPGPG